MADAKHTTNGHRLYNVTCLSRPPAASYPWRVSAALLTDHESMEAADREADRHRAAVVESSPEVAALRARVAELEAAAKPKARDESVPPPGWILWWKDGDEQTPENIERADRAMRDGPLVTAIPIAQAWRFYDREHGYTPDEARIRADERAKLSKALHRMAVEETESDARSAGLHEAAMFVERGAK